MTLQVRERERERECEEKRIDGVTGRACREKITENWREGRRKRE